MPPGVAVSPLATGRTILLGAWTISEIRDFETD